MAVNSSMRLTLQAQSISFQFSERLIFNQWSSEFEAGITWVKGLNGVGKSTLLKLLGGALDLQRGTIQLGELDSALHPIAFRKQVFLFHGDLPHLPWLKVGELIDLYLSLYSNTARSDLNRHLAAFNIKGIENVPTATLSLGQHKKLMLAISLSLQPTVLLLDEPFNALDTSSLAHLRTSLSDSTRLASQIIVLASHIEPMLPIKKEIEIQSQ